MYINLRNKDVKIKKCKSFFSRLIGFMFRFEPIETGLFFPKCKSIHTFFMYQNIDLALVDEKNKIVYLYQHFKPWQILWPKPGVYGIYEFGDGYLDEYSVNETLKVKGNV
jgi:uncharacterized membrane protein (UPF0127 family)